jgi:hypothetical protein
MKQAAAVDDKAKTWVIYQGDPAWKQCRSLMKAGVAEVVLPRQTLLHGTLPALDSMTVHEVPIDVVCMSADVRAIVARQIRLKDCVQWLWLNRISNCRDQTEVLSDECAN